MNTERKNHIPDDMEHISEEELAHSEGFSIDDDGHWVPLDERDDEYRDDLLCDDDEEDNMAYEDEYINEIDFARSEGFYVDDDGNWIPEEETDWF